VSPPKRQQRKDGKERLKREVERSRRYRVPVSLIFLAGSGSRRLLSCFLFVGIIVSSCLRFALWDGPVSADRVYVGLDTRADSLLTGCLIAVLFENNTLKFSRRYSTLLGLLGVVILAPLFVFASSKGSFVYLGGFTLVALAAGLLLISLLTNSAIVRLFEMRWLVWVGQLSYGIYLWHLICFKVAQQVTMRWTSSIFLITMAEFALTLLVASVSFYWLERPCLRLKDRLGRSHSTHPPILEAQAI